MTEEKKNSILELLVKSFIAPLVTLITFFVFVFAGYFWLDDRYAKAEEVEEVSRRLEVKITGDFLQQTQSRIWQLQDRLGDQPNDVTAQENLRSLQHEKVQLEKDLERLKGRKSLEDINGK